MHFYVHENITIENIRNAPVNLPIQEKPIYCEISIPIPSFQDYIGTLHQLQQWHQEAPELTELKKYGKSSKGFSLVYLRIKNKRISEQKPVVLITGCIHGNETWATTTMLGFIGTILSRYGKDAAITSLIDNRDIYFIPVISPDSFSYTRYVDGVDPNRDFPSLKEPNKISTPSILAIQILFSKIQPKAVLSGHTYGRMYIYPWGDMYQYCPNDSDYNKILGRMGQLSQYTKLQGCNNYAKLMIGTELDWYYRHKAISVVMEIGTHQRVPTDNEIKSELNRTFSAIFYFVREAPKIVVK
jgi:murein tripeptide amidase MpaA